jgi:hypothetical protein
MDSSERSLEDVEMSQPLVSKSSSSSPISALALALDGRNSKGIFQNFYDESNKNGKVLSACAFYSFCSVSMVLVNKSLASRCVYVCVYACMYVCEMESVLIPCLHICMSMSFSSVIYHVSRRLSIHAFKNIVTIT